MPKAEKNEFGLTEKQEQFCQEFLIDLNATKASIRAGFSKKTSAEQGHALLKMEKVQARISALQKERAQRCEVDQDFVLKELLKIANVDLADAYDDEGRLLSVKKMPERFRKALAGVDVFEEFDGVGQDRYHVGDTRKIKLWDKIRALELLGRHLKLFTEKIEHSGKITWLEHVTNSLKDEK